MGTHTAALMTAPVVIDRGLPMRAYRSKSLIALMVTVLDGCLTVQRVNDGSEVRTLRTIHADWHGHYVQRKRRK